MTAPRVWLLIGTRRGDNNQVLALGEALGVPFETRTIFYRWTARLWMKVFPQSVGHLTAASRRWLRPPWPDLVIGIGRRTVPVASWIQEQSGGRANLVRLGHPRAPTTNCSIWSSPPANIRCRRAIMSSRCRWR